jgi:Uma2 family endonuclease
MNTKAQLTLEEFWALPEGETAYELVDGKAIPKVSPKSFHSFLQGALDRLIHAWCRGKGRVGPEWSVALKRNGKDWVPTPDLTYVSYDRLPRSWRRNEACPIPCELVIEIISPDQSRDELAQKAQDYLNAGVLRVWVVDPEVFDITVFFPDGTNRLYAGDSKIVDTLLPGLELTPQLVFEEAELL